jgi:hypothetical protein
MDSQFTITIGDIDFRLNSMNTIEPKLFQLYVPLEGKQRRFHLVRQGINYLFAQREDCPSEILAYETELSERLYSLFQ